MPASADKTTREILRETIASHPGITEKQLGEVTGFSTSKISPNRLRLWQAGEIEPTTEVGWRKAMVSQIKSVGWRVVAPERASEVAERAQKRRLRNARSAEARARQAAEALADPVVFRIYQQLTKHDRAESGAGQRRREQALREREIEAKKEARRVRDETDASADMKRKLASLWEARSTVAAVDRHLIKERARVAEGREQRISTADWLVVLRDVGLILGSMGSIWHNVRDLGDGLACPVCGSTQSLGEGHLMPFVVDVDAQEIDVEEVDAQELQARSSA